MPTNKTALEQLQERLLSKIRPDTDNIVDRVHNITIYQNVADLCLFKPTERTQIEEAFDKGTSNGINIATRTGTTYKKASDYFTQKYKDGE